MCLKTTQMISLTFLLHSLKVLSAAYFKTTWSAVNIWEDPATLKMQAMDDPQNDSNYMYCFVIEISKRTIQMYSMRPWSTTKFSKLTLKVICGIKL